MSQAFPYSEAVCRVKNPHDYTPEQIDLMVNACREMAVFHGKSSRELAFLYKKYGFDPESIRSYDDLSRIPFVGVTAMKYYLLTSLPEDQAVLKLTSSGTRGQKTQIWFDEASLSRCAAQKEMLWDQEGLISKEPTNYCCFIYDPEQAGNLGIAFSVQFEQRWAPAKESYFAVRKNESGAWQFRAEETIAKLRQFEKDGSPVRLLGIPSFVFELLLAMEGKPPIRLPKGSLMITGGGWKAAEDKKITRPQLRKMVEERLGLPDPMIRDDYGMAEHSAPYIECDKHRFHIPVYNRIIARDPVTMEELPPGKPGLLELITPYNAMMPNLAILSTDLGYIDEMRCDCGRNSPTFTLIGRGGLVKHKGCALTANEIVKRN